MQKLYCYVDESGHHNKNEPFIVGVVIVGTERDDMGKVLELIERDSGKGRVKWTGTDYAHRLAYMRRVFDLRMFHNKLYYAAYQSIDAPVIEMVARGLVAAWQAHEPHDPIATAFIDGLPASKVQDVLRLLRDSDVPTQKVRGVGKDETSALIRLADSVCGFVRASLAEQEDMKTLFDRAYKRGAIQDARDNKKPT